MPAHTATDAQSLIDGSDLSSAADFGDGVVINGVLSRNYAESYDINGRDARLLVSNADADRVSIGGSVEINSVTYTVRAKNTGDQYTGLILEL